MIVMMGVWGEEDGVFSFGGKLGLNREMSHSFLVAKWVV